MAGNGILDADMATLGAWFARGWGWWVDELRALVPARLRRGARRRALYWDAAAGCLRHDPAWDGGAINQVTHGVAADPASAEVILPAGACLVREVTVPPMALRDVPRMVALDADRLMPVPGTIVACTVLGAVPGGLRVAVAGLPRAAAEALAGALDGAPAALLAPVPGHAASVDLLPALRAAGLLGGARGSAARWWAVVAFLFVLNAGLLVWRDAAETDAMQAIVDQQASAVNTARAITARARRADALAGAVAAARARAEPLALLARIDAALPPGAWLQRFAWDGGAEIRLAGYRPAQADVAGALRRAGFGVARYGDGDATGASPLGQPFEATLRMKGQ